MTSRYRPGLATLSERRASKSADAIASIYLGTELTYREVHNRVLVRVDEVGGVATGVDASRGGRGRRCEREHFQ